MIDRTDLRWLDHLTTRSSKPYDINEKVDRLFIDKTLETKTSVISKQQHQTPPKQSKNIQWNKILLPLISIAVVVGLLLTTLPVFYGGDDFDINISIEPADPVEGDLVFINATIPTFYNITNVSANISGIDTINLSFIDNTTTDQFWQGTWILHNLSAGDHIVNISAVGFLNTSYYMLHRWNIVSNVSDNESVDNESSEPDQNETIPPDVDDVNWSTNDTVSPDIDDTNVTDNEPVAPVGLNLSLDSDKNSYVVNETVLIEGTVSYNSSLVDAFVRLLIDGSNYNSSESLNVTDGEFSYQFIPTVIGDYIVQANASYENETVKEEVDFYVQIMTQNATVNDTDDSDNWWIYGEKPKGVIYQAPTLNWTKFWQVFKKQAIWRLEAWNPVQETWVDANELLTVHRNYTSDDSCKIGLEFTTPDNGVTTDWRFSLAIDYRVKEYVNHSGNHEYTLTHEVEGETFNVVFNWSDMLQYSGLIFRHGITEIDGKDCFWFRVRRNSVPPDYHVYLDPTYTVYTGASVGLFIPSQRKLVRQSDGTLWCAFYEGIHDVHVAWSDDNGTSWNDIEVWGAQDSQYPSLAVDSNNVVHLVFSSEKNDVDDWQLEYSNSSNWATIVQIRDEDKHHQYPSIAIDSNDNIHIVYEKGEEGTSNDDQIGYVRSLDNGGSWEAEQILTDEPDPGDDDWRPSIAINSSDAIHVVFYAEDHNTPSLLDYDDILHMQSDDGGGTWTDWEADPVYRDSGHDQRYSCIAIDDNDKLHVVWYGLSQNTNDQVAYSHNASSSWSTAEWLTWDASYDYRYPSISVNDNDYIHAAIEVAATIRLNHSVNDTTSWSTDVALAGDYGLPNLISAQHPTIGGLKTNRPKTGYAFVCSFGSANITYHASDDLTWDEPLNTSIDSISPYNVTSNPLTITASNTTAVDNVTFYYRYSSDNSTWTGGDMTDEIGIIYEETNAQQSTTSNKILETLDSDDFIPGEDYLLVASAHVRGSDNAARIGTKLRHGSGSTNWIFTPTDEEQEGPFDITTEWVYSTFIKWTAIYGEDITLFGDITLSDTAYWTDVSLMAIPLDDLIENTDWFYDDDTTAVDNMDDSWSTSGASIIFTPDGSSNYLALGTSRCEFDTNVDDDTLRMRLYNGSSELTRVERDSEDIADEAVLNLMYVLNSPTAQSTTYSLQFCGDSTHDKLSSQLFILRLDAFENFIYNQTSEDSRITETVWTRKANNSVSLNYTGNVLALWGGCYQDNAGSGEPSSPWNSAVKYRGGSDTSTKKQTDDYRICSWDNPAGAEDADIGFAILFDVFSVSDTNSHYYWIDVSAEDDDFDFVNSRSISMAIITERLKREGWRKWTGGTNPDTSSPWSWSFNFPNGTGYYEFYSMGKKSGWADEGAPDSADAICHYPENISINVTPSEWNQGSVNIGDTNETTSFYFNLTNEGNVALDITINATNATNTTTQAQWNLTATPDHDNFSLQYNKSGGGTWTYINITFDTFVTDLAVDSWQTFDLKLLMATTSSTVDPMEVTVTFKSVAS